MQHMWICGSALRHLPSPRASLGAWISAVFESPADMKRCMLRDAHSLSLSAGLPAASSPRVMPMEFRCGKCSRSFPRIDMLRTHEYRVHGYRNPVHANIRGTICAFCGMQFHTYQRLYKHAAYGSKRCNAGYLALVHESTSGPVDIGPDSSAPPQRRKCLRPPPCIPITASHS